MSSKGLCPGAACDALRSVLDPEEGILHPWWPCPHHKSQMGLRESSRVFPYAQCPKWWEKREKTNLRDWFKHVRPWHRGVTLSLGSLWAQGSIVPVLPWASCTVLHVPWHLTTCLLISRDVFWGKIIAFTGEISLCSSWIAEELEGTAVTGNDVM